MVMARATIVAAAAANLNLFKGGGGVGGLLLCSSSSSSSAFSAYSQSLRLRRVRVGIRIKNVSFSYPQNHKFTTSHSFSSKTIISTKRRRFCSATTDNIKIDSSEEKEEEEEEEAEEGSKIKIKIKEAADLLDIRVGRILKAWRHEEADSLYVEEVDVGEPEPRIICSGLVNYVPLHLLQDARVVVLANLKPRNMRGVKSCGMLMAASDASHSNVELLVPPEGAIPGDRIWFGCENDPQRLPPPASPNQIQKKKIWEAVQPHLKTHESGVAMLLAEHVMRTSSGAVSSKSLNNANIS